MAMINYLYISPEFPPNYMNFITQLDKAAVNVWAIGESDFTVLPEHVRSCIKWYVKADLYDKNRIREITNYLLNDHVMPMTGKGFDVVESHNEHWLRLQAFINDAFKIQGISSKNIDMIKKKSEMKKSFISLGLDPAKGRLVVDLKDALKLASELSYPVILKPDEGVGATRLFKIENETQLKEAWSKINDDYIMEEFLNADIVTYDGLLDWKGNIIFENSLVYECGVIENVQNGRDQFFYTTRTIPQALKKMGKDIVDLFGLKKQFFHFEFFKDGQDYRPIEINARPPGGQIIDMMNYSIDDDLYAAYAKMIAKQDNNISSNKKFFCAYIGRRDRDYAHSHHEIVSKYHNNLANHFTNPELFWQAMGKYIYLMRAETEKTLYEIKEFILLS
ncbi:MAG: ATP-grasp domain-containing protein [bacterium]